MTTIAIEQRSAWLNELQPGDAVVVHTLEADTLMTVDSVVGTICVGDYRFSADRGVAYNASLHPIASLLAIDTREGWLAGLKVGDRVGVCREGEWGAYWGDVKAITPDGRIRVGGRNYSPQGVGLTTYPSQLVEWSETAERAVQIEGACRSFEELKAADVTEEELVTLIGNVRKWMRRANLALEPTPSALAARVFVVSMGQSRR